jgi:hypothetical protein
MKPVSPEEALTERVRNTLGAQLLQILQIETSLAAALADNTALRARVAELTPPADVPAV